MCHWDWLRRHTGALFQFFLLFSCVVVGSYLSSIPYSAPANAKGPGVRYCFYSTCHRVLTLAETRRRVGKSEWLMASYYDDCRRDAYNPCGLTSSGEPFFPGRHDNAASPIYPDGTILLIWNPATKQSAIVRVNNAGPYWGNRKLDVSRAVAEKLGFRHRGVAKLKVEVIRAPNRAEARYKRNRRYPAVAGYIGQFQTFQAARYASAAVVAVNALAASTLALPVGAAVNVARTSKVQSRWTKLAKIPERKKSALRRKHIRMAEQEWQTRFAELSESPQVPSNKATTSRGEGDVWSTVRIVPSDTLPIDDDDARIAPIKVANAISVAEVVSLPAKTITDMPGKRVERVTLANVRAFGRRPRVQSTEKVERLVAQADVLTPQASSQRENRMPQGFLTVAVQDVEIKRLSLPDLLRIVEAEADRGLMVPRSLFAIETLAVLKVRADKDIEEQLERDGLPKPHRELPELPKKFARSIMSDVEPTDVVEHA